MEKICSEYSDKVSFRSGLSQSAILSTRLMEDPDCMHEVEDTLLTNALYCIFPENPLQYGFYLNSIGNGKSNTPTLYVHGHFLCPMVILHQHFTSNSFLLV